MGFWKESFITEVRKVSDSKKYYYLKLKEDFFESDEMILLESLPDGYLYSNILMKLYVRSLRNEGKLMVNDKIPYNAQMIATVTRHQVGTVEKALSIFQELKLIEVLDNGAIYMSDIQNFIGKSSTEADRKREYRSRIEAEKTALLGQMSEQETGQMSDQTSGQMTGQMSDNSPPENRDKRLENRSNNIVEKESRQNTIKEIVEYLNLKTKKSFKASTKATQRHINARLEEGYSLEDFKTVIDKKTKEWKGTEMDQYLRPETLFGTKFEGYLNQSDKPVSKPTQQKSKNKFHNFEQRSYDYQALEQHFINKINNIKDKGEVR